MSEFRRESEDLTAATEIPENFDLEKWMIGNDLYEKLMKAVGDLREESVLRAFMEEDMTGVEVGKKFGFSADKARKIKADALQKIRISPLGKQLILDNFNKTAKLN